MDVKDIVPNKALSRPQVDGKRSLQRKGSELSSSLTAKNLDSLIITNKKSEGARSSSDRQSSRSKANDVISAINVADEAAKEIDSLVKSISGIAQQASEDIPEPRREILESEARELVSEIRKASERTSGGLRPLAGDEIILEVEQELGRTLEVILPDTASEGLGLGEISFTPKDGIINVVKSVAVARERLDELKEAISSAKSNIQSTIDELDVATQNVEASTASVRDVDQALTLASSTRLGISLNPTDALDSFGNLTQSALNLLEG